MILLTILTSLTVSMLVFMLLHLTILCDTAMRDTPLSHDPRQASNASIRLMWLWPPLVGFFFTTSILAALQDAYLIQGLSALVVGILTFFIARDANTPPSSPKATEWPEQNGDKVEIERLLAGGGHHWADNRDSSVVVYRAWDFLPLRGVVYMARHPEPHIVSSRVFLTTRGARRHLTEVFQAQRNQAAAQAAGHADLVRLQQKAPDRVRLTHPARNNPRSSLREQG